MRFFNILILQFLLSLILNADTLETNYQIKNKLDTVYVAVPSDSMIVNVKSRELLPEQTWWDKHQGNMTGNMIGALLGALFASLIAIYTVRKTYLNTKKIEEEKITYNKIQRENTYCGLLFMIVSELRGHDMNTTRLREEIELFTNLVENMKDIISEDPFSKYDINFIETCRIKILDYAFFNTEIMSAISNYLNSLYDLNYYLNLERIRKVKIHFKDDDELFIEAFKECFEEVNLLINRLEEGRKEIEKEILLEINSFPHSDIDVDKLLKKLNNK
jgi:hypothetical protein